MAQPTPDKPISPALNGLLSVLIGAYPDSVSRDALCASLHISREHLRQRLHRLKELVGSDALELTDSSARLSAAHFEQVRHLTVATHFSAGTPADSARAAVGSQFRDLILDIAPLAPDDARQMLVSQGWIARAIPVPELLHLLEVTRPSNQQCPYAGEWRNFDILVRSLHGCHKDVVLARVDAAKRIARRYNQKAVYRRAHLLGVFTQAGETALPLAPLLTRDALQDLPHYDKLSYISRLFLECRGDHAVRATEWVAAGIDRESEADQAHFWRNATSLSLYVAGRNLASEARKQTQATKSFGIDLDSQRCVLVSLARECIHSKDPDGAEKAIDRYQQLSQSMGWSYSDALEIHAKASLLRGDVLEVKRTRDALLKQFQRAGHDQKRLHRMAISDLDAALP